MRILAVATSYPKGPGDSTAPFIRSISRGLAAHGAEVDLLLPHHPDLRWPEGDPPVRLHTFRYLPGSSPGGHIWGYAGALRADVSVKAQAWAVAPLAVSATLFRLASLARKIRPDVIHANWVLPNGPPAVMVGRHLKIPVVTSLHGSGTFLAESASIMARAAAFAFQGSAAVTACSGDLAERAYRLGADPRRTEVIPYGVDPNGFRPPTAREREEARNRMEVPPAAFLVLSVGRLVEKKGFRYLLEAFQQAFTGGGAERGAPLLWIAGSGDLGQQLGDRAEELGLGEGFRLLGNVDRHGVRDLYRAADVLVVPSVRDSAGNVDGLPNVIMEGMGSGLPIVASRIAGIPDVLTDGENGVLVPEKDPGALAAALRRMADDQGSRKALGDAARRSVEERLSWEQISGRYLQAMKRAEGGYP